MERHAYFIIDAVHNTYSNYSIYFCMCLFKAFCSLSNTYFQKEIQHSPLTCNTHNRMYKAFAQSTSHACLPLMEGMMFAMATANPEVSRGMGSVFKGLLVLGVCQRGSCFTLSRCNSLCSNTSIKTEQQPKPWVSSAHTDVDFSACAQHRSGSSPSTDKAIHVAKLKPTAFLIHYSGISSNVTTTLQR